MPIALQQSLSALERRALERLAGNAGVAAMLLDAWSRKPATSAQSARSLIDLAGLGVTEEMSANDVLTQLVQVGLVEPQALGFRARDDSHLVFKRLALALHAIAYYVSSIHRDATTAQVVLTKPPQPSVLEQQLAQRGWRTSGLEATHDAFHDVVSRARKRVVVMTPFLDLKGARWLRDLLEHTQDGVERVLVLRTLEDSSRNDFPIGYPGIADWLREHRVQVLNYSIPRVGGAGRETFHAKILLCDDSAAYVGSSNLTAASLEHSMEMGVAVFGRAAAQVAVVVEAVLAAAVDWH